MKYWIGINVISNDKVFLNEVENASLAKLDNRLWHTDEHKSVRGTNDDGNKFFHASLFFNNVTDRDDFHTILRSINGMLISAMPGSFIKTTKCWHDEKINGLCTKIDELTFQEVV